MTDPLVHFKASKLIVSSNKMVDIHTYKRSGETTPSNQSWPRQGNPSIQTCGIAHWIRNQISPLWPKSLSRYWKCCLYNYALQVVALERGSASLSISYHFREVLTQTFSRKPPMLCEPRLSPAIASTILLQTSPSGNSISLLSWQVFCATSVLTTVGLQLHSIVSNLERTSLFEKCFLQLFFTFVYLFIKF